MKKLRVHSERMIWDFSLLLWPGSSVGFVPLYCLLSYLYKSFKNYFYYVFFSEIIYIYFWLNSLLPIIFSLRKQLCLFSFWSFFKVLSHPLSHLFVTKITFCSYTWGSWVVAQISLLFRYVHCFCTFTNP